VQTRTARTPRRHVVETAVDDLSALDLDALGTGESGPFYHVLLAGAGAYRQFSVPGASYRSEITGHQLVDALPRWSGVGQRISSGRTAVGRRGDVDPGAVGAEHGAQLPVGIFRVVVLGCSLVRPRLAMVALILLDLIIW
jgi:hypothetical protein